MMAEIHEYIIEKSEKSADKYIDGIYDSVKKLEKHPEACGPCINKKLKEVGYRCCKYKNHIIIYLLSAKIIEILAIIHSSRNPTSVEDILNK